MGKIKIRQPPEDLPIKKAAFFDLPFIKKLHDQIVYWSVKPSGDYVKDCQTGREYAALALEHMQQADYGPLLTWCIMDMPRKKDCSGIEVGFLEFFAEIAISNFRNIIMTSGISSGLARLPVGFLD
jgi:hypothetical protein